MRKLTVDFFSPAVFIEHFFKGNVDNVLILFAAERAKNLGGYNEAFFQIPTESTPKNFSKIFAIFPVFGIFLSTSGRK